MNKDTGETRVSRRGLLIAGGTLTATGALAACGGKATNSAPNAVPADGTAAAGASGAPDVNLTKVVKGKKIGVIAQSAAAVTQGRGIKEARRVAELVGWDAAVFDAGGDPNKVPGAINDFITKKVDAIVAVVVPGSFFGESLNAAVSAKIPVIGVFTGPATGIAARIEPSEFISEAKIGEYVVQRMNYEGKIALLNWEEIPPLVQRGAQFRAVLKQYPDIEIVEDLKVKLPGQIEDAKAKTSAFLPKHKDLKAIWGGWDEPAFGANQAVKESGRDDVFVVGCDGNLETFDAIRSGEPLAATCANDIELMTRQAFKTIDDIGAGRPVAKVTTVDSPFISKDNVPPKGSYAKGTVTPFFTGSAS